MSKKRPPMAEAIRLQAQMIPPEEEEADAFEVEIEGAQKAAASSQNQILVYRRINKGYQNITDGIPVRVPTEVLEWVYAHLDDTTDRITVLFRLLELGKGVMEKELEAGDVVIRYPRGG